ncbi:hypothetical protein GX917_00495 [Candidatus Falkowbacteria bacterium]|jgi:hypothetical protein|nr:hypothetical protein [Candidatus Falkowbacteria bacterium]
MDKISQILNLFGGENLAPNDLVMLLLLAKGGSESAGKSVMMERIHRFRETAPFSIQPEEEFKIIVNWRYTLGEMVDKCSFHYAIQTNGYYSRPEPKKETVKLLTLKLMPSCSDVPEVRRVDVFEFLSLRYLFPGIQKLYNLLAEEIDIGERKYYPQLLQSSNSFDITPIEFIKKSGNYYFPIILKEEDITHLAI